MISGSSIISSKIGRQRIYDPANPLSEGEVKWLKGERKAGQLKTQTAIARINNAADAYLSTLPNVWEKDETGKYIKDTETDIALRSAQIGKFQSVLDKTVTAEQLSNPALRSTGQRLLLQDYVNAVAWAGKLDSIKDSLDATRNLPKEEIEKLGLNPEYIKDYVGDISSHIDTLYNIS